MLDIIIENIKSDMTRKMEGNNIEEKEKNISVEFYDDKNKFLRNISYKEKNIFLPLCESVKIGGKKGNRRIYKIYYGEDLIRCAFSNIIEYSENFEYEGKDYKNGWYYDANYEFNVTEINKEYRSKDVIIVMVERQEFGGWDFERIDKVEIKVLNS